MHVDVFASRQIDRELAVELNAKPCFRLLPYEQSRAFGRIDALIQTFGFAQDLRRAWAARCYPFCYVNSVLAPQFAAIGNWLTGFPEASRPWVAIEFGAPSGAGTDGWFARFADQYRAAASDFHSLDSSRLLLFSFDAAASFDYAQLLELPVAVLPPVHCASGPLRLRRRDPDQGLTLGFLGQQRTEKGAELLCEIIEQVLDEVPSLRVLVHDGDASERPITIELKRVAARNAQVEFVHRPAGPGLWAELLDRTDLMVLPYEPDRYRASYSAVAVEAVSAGIPLVVPRGTTLETLAREYQGRAVCFEGWEASSVSLAILTAVDEFESLAESANGGAAVWNARNGAGRFIDRLLEFFPHPSLNGTPAFGQGPGVSEIEVRSLDAILAVREIARQVVHSIRGADRHAP